MKEPRPPYFAPVTTRREWPPRSLTPPSSAPPSTFKAAVGIALLMFAIAAMVAGALGWLLW